MVGRHEHVDAADAAGRRGLRVWVVVDSTASLPAEARLGLPMSVAPLHVTLDGRDALDGVDLSPEEFYRRLRETDAPAQTAAPSPGAFLDAFRRAFDDGCDVLCITVSSQLSATHATAQAAMQRALADAPGRSGRVLDSATAGGAVGLVALAAARAASAGATLDDVAEVAEGVASRVYFIGVLPSLRRLQRGGRVPRVAAWAAVLLNIVPVLAIWPGEGTVRMLHRPRTMERAVERVLAVVARESAGRPLRAVVMHADAPADAAALRAELERRFACTELHTLPFTPVIGAHTGPGVIGVAFYAEDVV